MVATHKLKIKEQFADAVFYEHKTFEVRKNDRGFQCGDYVEFTVVSKEGDAYYGRSDKHPLTGERFEITYVLSGWGIQPDYVAFGIKEVKSGSGC